MNDYWLKHIKENGIDLIVEIKLSFVEFKKLLSDTIGGEQSDDDVLEFWDIANRRILPTDTGTRVTQSAKTGDCRFRSFNSTRFT